MAKRLVHPCNEGGQVEPLLGGISPKELRVLICWVSTFVVFCVIPLALILFTTSDIDDENLASQSDLISQIAEIKPPMINIAFHVSALR
jgi:hypothetical protein